MQEFITNILDISRNIDKNIKKCSSDRGFLSQNILSELRNFVEAISLYFYAKNTELTDNNYKNIKKANEYVKTKGNLNVLSKFHKLLQISTSHYTLDEENSERLMLKYYEYLLRIKKLMKTEDIDILENIEDFPLNIDRTLQEYYSKIAEKLEQSFPLPTESEYNDRYYIQKIKPFFIKQEIYYEVTFIIANDYENKFDRIIAFTQKNILQNYALKLFIHKDYINILGKDMPILIIDNWEIAIRECELNHLSDILGENSIISTNHRAYKIVMKILKSDNLNLLELVELDDDYFQNLSTFIQANSENFSFLRILEKCRAIIKSNSNGSNVLRYLLYNLNNRIIKLQKDRISCFALSNLFLSNKSIPFEKMPFMMSLKGHNPSINDLLNCIKIEGREHELLARHIKNNTEQKGNLYTNIDELRDFGDVDSLIQKYNNCLYYKHKPQGNIEKYKNYVYINEYESNVCDIILKLKDLAKYSIKGYSISTERWLREHNNPIDCEEKRRYITQLFENSAVSFIYGPAGTGKSTLIKYISKRFTETTKLYLANTNSAIDNLKRKVNALNATFMTIARFLSEHTNKVDYSILFIDECSTVSNSDMLKILNKAQFELIVLVGDVYQIEAILFGNWFKEAPYFLNKNAICELTKPYRTNDPKLLRFWNQVRNCEDNIVEIMTKNNYSHSLDESIFTQSNDDEIILCLNYDGLYGINNINRFLQVANPNKAVSWAGQTYKIGDPILFNETKRFGSVIYNNMKGKINNIQKKEEKIYFDVELNKSINEMEAKFSNLEFVKNLDNRNSIVRFFVNKYKNQDEDNEGSSENVVPFQIAYAISIHRAQGLEYNSVKIVITEEVDEMITHSIFYTAITRTREKLKIFWSPETENKIIASFKAKNSNKDCSILSQKYKDLKQV
ncbi:MAG: AAA family ATPase [Alphaproteobacteria bacterium]|nr:AAA family ATPase [Alphaproteobacteria bacterium]